MNELVGGLVVLGVLIVILVKMFGGRLSSFSLARAGRTSGGSVATAWNSQLITWLLAIMSTTLGVIEVSPSLGKGALSISVFILMIAALGYALDSKLILFALSVAGIAGAGLSIAHSDGAGLFIAALVLSTLVLWLAGFLRGIIGNR